MDANDDLVLHHHRGRGRPSNKDKEIMACSKKMRKELKKMKAQMSFREGTEILLAFSLATDEMTRHVHMFPEVFYMDVTANTNLQKRDLFLMVVKDANGQTFIGNATVIPSGKRWVFSKIYKSFFLKLYGEPTIGRNRLAITDDDIAEWGPLDNCIRTMECYSESCHMLCVFHAVVMAYKEQVHRLLPHQTGDKYKLTDIGELYGETKLD